MSNRFSRHTLFQLRNEIPIGFVITDILKIPSKNSEGYFRFLCPICMEFNSAINPKTNLARCFRCKKNFNPIDLVMVDKALPFKLAAQFLLPFLAQASPSVPSRP